MKRHYVPLFLTVGILALALIYAIVRGNENRNLAVQIQALELATQRAQTLVSGIDPALLKSRPAPQPDLPGWLAANTLKKFQDKVQTNEPTRTNRGVLLSLVRLTPLEVSALFSQFTQVGVRLPHLILSDPDGDGSWTMEVNIEVIGQ